MLFISFLPKNSKFKRNILLYYVFGKYVKFFKIIFIEYCVICNNCSKGIFKQISRLVL